MYWPVLKHFRKANFVFVLIWLIVQLVLFFDSLGDLGFVQVYLDVLLPVVISFYRA